MYSFTPTEEQQMLLDALAVMPKMISVLPPGRQMKKRS